MLLTTIFHHEEAPGALDFVHRNRVTIMERKVARLPSFLPFKFCYLKVTLDEIGKYMKNCPDEGSATPALSEHLRMHIPRSSLRYLLIHLLGIDIVTPAGSQLLLIK